MLVGRGIDEEIGCGEKETFELSGHGEEEEDGDSRGDGKG